MMVQPVQKTGAKLIIFYQPNTSIDERGDYIDSTDKTALQLFQRICNANGVIFVDMTESFTKLYDEKQTLAHGFTNTAVGVGHLNKYGHRVIAETLTKVLEEEEKNGIE